MYKLTDENTPFFALVGRNGEGKSYHLNETLTQLPNSAIYISEEGIARILYQKNYVSIDKEQKLYLYTDEKARGNRTSTEQQTIGTNALNVIKFCQNVSNPLNGIVNKSQGQNKLQNLMNIFLSYNLNNIKFILFDEPENFLDEEFLKVISNLIKILLENDYKVRIATHNSRLLSLLHVDIDFILLLSNRQEIQVTLEDVKQIFKNLSGVIEDERVSQKFEEDASIRYKLAIWDNVTVFANFNECNLKNIEFYRTLFYSKVIIVEGNSDVEALNSIKYSFDDSVIIYSPNGKAWIPFFALLYKIYNKEVTVIIDVDNTLQNHATAITAVLENMESIRIVKHEPDMETFYGIDTKAIGDSLGMSKSVRNSNRGWLKQMSAYTHFKNSENSKILTKHIFGDDTDIFKFE